MRLNTISRSLFTALTRLPCNSKLPFSLSVHIHTIRSYRSHMHNLAIQQEAYGKRKCVPIEECLTCIIITCEGLSCTMQIRQTINTYTQHHHIQDGRAGDRYDGPYACDWSIMIRLTSVSFTMVLNIGAPITPVAVDVSFAGVGSAMLVLAMIVCRDLFITMLVIHLLYSLALKQIKQRLEHW